ncbi:hypothetical protein BDR03DRAFT_970900 [Suillus americanus]|nr:hypothetical protein BDR03DRAFT_970900 [Suillus americanus]
MIASAADNLKSGRFINAQCITDPYSRFSDSNSTFCTPVSPSAPHIPSFQLSDRVFQQLRLIFSNLLLLSSFRQLTWLQYFVCERSPPPHLELPPISSVYLIHTHAFTPDRFVVANRQIHILIVSSLTLYMLTLHISFLVS